MTTQLTNFETALEAAWTGLAPQDDGSGLAYRFVDDLIAERGNGRHRELLWRLSPSVSVAGVDPSEQAEWTTILELFVHRNDRTYAAFRRAVHDEVTDLRLAFHAMGDLGAGVFEATLEGIRLDEIEPRARRDPHLGGGIPDTTIAVVTFTFNVLVQEA